MRVLICVTHLLGTGHLSRALTLGRAFSQAGHEAHVVSGGVPVANLSLDGVVLHQLPAVKSDGVNFTTLLSQEGNKVGEDLLQARKSALVSTLKDVRPDVVITELFPFGRRVLKAEFLALLNACRALDVRPVVAASVRDILAPPSKPRKALETDAIVAAYYDAVLVHSDAAITPLTASWPVSEMLADRLRYTGFVAPKEAGAHPDGTGLGEVLVTAGGGDVGLSLFESAIAAAAMDRDTTWRLLIGGSNKENIINSLRAKVQSGNVIVEPTRPDFREMLSGARAAVCMCGYNTVMDLLQSGTSAVFVPFDAGGEVEQTLRAESLSKQDGFAVVRSAEATPENLLGALRKVVGQKRAVADAKTLRGAQNTVEIVQKLLTERMVR